MPALNIDSIEGPERLLGDDFLPAHTSIHGGADLEEEFFIDVGVVDATARGSKRHSRTTATAAAFHLPALLAVAAAR